MSLVCLLVLAAQPGGFVTIPAGSYSIGGKDLLDNPLRQVHLASYSIGKYDVTNAQFAEFVRATGYVTDAERFHNAMVFKPGLPEFRWIQDPTASWHFPNGKSRGGLVGKLNHPVTSISYLDAIHYCEWARVRLPTLEEWEVASRAGSQTRYFFGEDETLIRKYANIWHGRNHLKADFSDGYMYTSPVGSFLPNPLGLYDIYGNVFQFCTGKLRTDHAPNMVHSRGGSWWCSKNACCFFNSEDIGTVSRRASFSNQGFRVVLLH